MNGDWLIADNVLGAVTTLGLTNANVTLSTSQAQANVIRLTGALTGNCAITVPLQKSYIVDNQTTGNFWVAVTATGSSTTVGLPQGSARLMFSDGTNVKYAVEDAMPGTYHYFAGTGFPIWMSGFSPKLPYLVCNGSTFSAATYPALAAQLGGTTLPDMRGRTMFALDPTGSRIDGNTFFPNGNTLFAAGGNQLSQLDVNSLPSHNHGVNDFGHAHTLPYNSAVNGPVGGGSVPRTGFGSTDITGTSGTGISIQFNGSNSLFSNVPPAIIAGVVMVKT
jgi:microcystin-dependent protein